MIERFVDFYAEALLVKTDINYSESVIYQTIMISLLILCYQIRIRPPNAKGRLDILKIHASKVKMSDSVDLSSYASNLPGIISTN